MIKTTVHEVTIADYEDPDIHVAAHLYDWEKSDAGKFVFENSLEPPTWYRTAGKDYHYSSYKVVAYFDEKTHTYWSLKYK